MDGRAPWSSMCMCLHTWRASSYAPTAIEEGCIDGREASVAASAVEVLKASGPQGRPVSQSPIQATYGPAMMNAPLPLLSVWVLRGGEGCTSLFSTRLRLRFAMNAAKLAEQLEMIQINDSVSRERNECKALWSHLSSIWNEFLVISLNLLLLFVYCLSPLYTLILFEI